MINYYTNFFQLLVSTHNFQWLYVPCWEWCECDRLTEGGLNFMHDGWKIVVALCEPENDEATAGEILEVICVTVGTVVSVGKSGDPISILNAWQIYLSLLCPELF